MCHLNWAGPLNQTKEFYSLHLKWTFNYMDVAISNQWMNEWIFNSDANAMHPLAHSTWVVDTVELSRVQTDVKTKFPHVNIALCPNPWDKPNSRTAHNTTIGTVYPWKGPTGWTKATNCFLYCTCPLENPVITYFSSVLWENVCESI